MATLFLLKDSGQPATVVMSFLLYTAEQPIALAHKQRRWRGVLFYLLTRRNTHTHTRAALNMLIEFVVPLKSLLAGEGTDIRELCLQLAICQVPILDRPNICLGLYCSSRHV